MQNVTQRAAAPTKTLTEPVGSNLKAPHVVVLTTCLGILLGALVLDSSGNQLRLGRTTLPDLCVLRQTTGIACPGCGLSRSIVAAVHGDWNASYGFHRMGPVVVVFLVIQVLYRLAWILLPAFRTTLSPAGRFADLALVPLMALLFINWIPTLLGIVGLGN